MSNFFMYLSYVFFHPILILFNKKEKKILTEQANYLTVDNGLESSIATETTMRKL